MLTCNNFSGDKNMKQYQIFKKGGLDIEYIKDSKIGCNCIPQDSVRA